MNGFGLVNGSGHFVASKRDNDALDLPPMAEALHITFVAASFRAGGCFNRGILSKVRHQFIGIAERDPAGNKELIHVHPTTSSALPDSAEMSLTSRSPLLGAISLGCRPIALP